MSRSFVKCSHSITLRVYLRLIVNVGCRVPDGIHLRIVSVYAYVVYTQ